VVNRLAVDPHAAGPAEPMESTVDRGISERVRQALAVDDGLAPHASRVQVATQAGVVRLTGTVPTPELKSRIGVVAGSVGSVVRVENALTVGGG